MAIGKRRFGRAAVLAAGICSQCPCPPSRRSAATAPPASRPGSRAFEQEAAAAGHSAGAIAALNGVAYDQKVINADRRQGVFTQSFNEFSGRMVADYRMKSGRGPAQEIRQHLFARRAGVRRAGAGHHRVLGA